MLWLTTNSQQIRTRSTSADIAVASLKSMLIHDAMSKHNIAGNTCQRFYPHGYGFMVMLLFVFAMTPQTGMSSVLFPVSLKLTSSCVW